MAVIVSPVLDPAGITAPVIIVADVAVKSPVGVLSYTSPVVAVPQSSTIAADPASGYATSG